MCPLSSLPAQLAHVCACLCVLVAMQPVDHDVHDYHRRRGKHSTQPATRHLQVLFVGSDDAALKALLAPYGPLECVRWPGQRTEECFVSFCDVDSAVAAKASLEGQLNAATVTRKSMEIRFADRADDVRVVATQPRAVHTQLGAADHAPTGLLLVNDFITADEEAQLLAALDASPWEHGIKRRVQHFGFEFGASACTLLMRWCPFPTKIVADYTTRSVNPSFGAVKPIPPLLVALFDRLRRAGLPETPDQITVNEYVPGIGIKVVCRSNCVRACALTDLLTVPRRHACGI